MARREIGARGGFGRTRLRRWRGGGTSKEALAGAAAVDITPKVLPVINSGGFLECVADKVCDPLHARGLVLDDGTKRIALMVVDSLMMPRELLDDVKRQASQVTGIREEHMLIAANHTHSAPSVMGALGSRCDETYAAFLPGRLVECLRQADANRVPARVGWAAVPDPEDTNCRFGFGGRSNRRRSFGRPRFARICTGYQNPDYIGRASGRPALTVLACRRPEGVAASGQLLEHYFGRRLFRGYYAGSARRWNGASRRVRASRVSSPYVERDERDNIGWTIASQKEITIDEYARASHRKPWKPGNASNTRRRAA